jgi:hypothetical protein
VNSRYLIAAGLVATVGLSAFFFVQNEAPNRAVAPPLEKQTSTATAQVDPQKAALEPPASAPAVMTREVPDPDDSTAPILPALPLQKGELAWEARIRAVVEAKGASNASIARALFEMLPGLPVEGKVTATEEAIQRTSSAEYRVLAQPVVTNPGIYPPCLIALFSDLMERPAAVQLPVLLAIARNSTHPLAVQAQENLQFVLKQNLGTDWGKWEGAIQQKLAEPK